MISKLNELHEAGLVHKQVHPVHHLIIWNYSPKAQYEQCWEVYPLLLQCRGLVTDDKGSIVAKGFPKFFNMEEEKHVATNDFEVFEKLDGSLILVFWYAGQMIVASRGSFTSAYALEAKRLLDAEYPNFEPSFKRYNDTIKNDTTYKLTFCLELIGFEQIVVSYPQSDLICTGVFLLDGDDKWFENCFQLESFSCNMKMVKKFDGLDWQNIKGLNWTNAEGFVVRFSNGQRCKIKFEDYIKLHRSMTNLSTRGIWEALAAGEPVSSILGDVPDEFYEKVHEYETQLKETYADIDDVSKRYFNYFKPLLEFRRKLFVEKVNLLLVEPYRSILLTMIDGKDYNEIIWKYIEPKFEKL